MNTLPTKNFTNTAIASNITTVAGLKHLMTPSAVANHLRQHACYGNSAVLTDVQLSRLQKDTEQRIVNCRAHMCLNEPIGPRPDSLKHFVSLQKWRRGNHSLERFESTQPLPGDEAVLLQRDYRLPNETE